MKVNGKLTFQGDKSLSHRAAIFSSMAKGKSTLYNYLRAEDTMNTLHAFEKLGVKVEESPDGIISVDSPGIHGWEKREGDILDMGNSGTGSRLLLGLFAGLGGMQVTIDGDESLRKRPMKRVSEPLTAIGARFNPSDKLPIQVSGAKLQPVVFEEVLGSAQVKSAMLLAALSSEVGAKVTEKIPSRDHTENMLRFVGVDIEKKGDLISLPGNSVIEPREYHIWGDISSAAFFVVLGLLADEGQVVVRNVLLNPYRDRYLDVLREMGGRIEVLEQKNQVGERGGDIVVYPSKLHGIEIPREWIPAVIDELPVLTVAGAFAEGEFSYRGAKELRVKESDRISAMVENLRNVGVEVEEFDDGLSVKGNPSAQWSGAVDSHMDHRIAMSFEIGRLKSASNRGEDACSALESTKDQVQISGKEWISTSFPDFTEKLKSLVCQNSDTEKKKTVITFDGYAGAGKSTLAGQMAERFGFYQIDSGALYRTYTRLILDFLGSSSQKLTPEILQDNELKAFLEKNQLRIAFDDKKQVLYAGDEVFTGDIRSPEVAANIKIVADAIEIRNNVNTVIREAGESYSIVADGRDMGTVVFPGADLKFFVTATVEERARRRLAEFQVKHPDMTQSEVEQELRQRDKNDAERKFGRMEPAPDAIFLDTTNRDLEAAFQIVESYLKTSE